MIIVTLIDIKLETNEGFQVSNIEQQQIACSYELTKSQDYTTMFMLNSTGHEMSIAHKR